MRGHTISSSEKNSFWTGAGLRHTQAASWAIDWTVHSKRKKLAWSLSHIVCRVRRSWQHSRESWERSKAACSRWKAGRFFTAAPGDKGSLGAELFKVSVHLTCQWRYQSFKPYLIGRECILVLVWHTVMQAISTWGQFSQNDVLNLKLNLSDFVLARSDNFFEKGKPINYKQPLTQSTCWIPSDNQIKHT